MGMILKSNEFGQWLANELEIRDMSVRRLSEKSQVTSQSICGYKNGYRTPTLRNLEDILDALGYRIEIKHKENWKDD